MPPYLSLTDHCVKPNENNTMNENELDRLIVQSAIEVHRTLGGSGLLESVYGEALCWELQQLNLDVKRQLAWPRRYTTLMREITSPGKGVVAVAQQFESVMDQSSQGLLVQRNAEQARFLRIWF